MNAGAILVVLLVVVAAAAGLSGMLTGGEGVPPPAQRLEATVTRVIDGDTVILSPLGRSRLIGVDTPEVHGRRECLGAQASAFTTRVLARQRVIYAVGVQPRDRYGRALVYLWLRDGRFFNELLVAGGYARALAIAPNVRFADRLRERASEARRAQRGLWSAARCSRPDEGARGSPTVDDSHGGREVGYAP